MLLHGDGNCAEVRWQLMGLSMPGWVMVCFCWFWHNWNNSIFT